MVSRPAESARGGGMVSRRIESPGGGMVSRLTESAGGGGMVSRGIESPGAATVSPGVTVSAGGASEMVSPGTLSPTA